MEFLLLLWSFVNELLNHTQFSNLTKLKYNILINESKNIIFIKSKTSPFSET